MYKKIENICIKENVKLAKLGLRENSFGNVSIRVNNDLFFIDKSFKNTNVSSTNNTSLLYLNL